jgi:hypothetical protein
MFAIIEIWTYVFCRQRNMMRMLPSVGICMTDGERDRSANEDGRLLEEVSWIGRAAATAGWRVLIPHASMLAMNLPCSHCRAGLDT